MISTGGQTISYPDLEKAVYEFERVLKNIGVTVANGSPLEGACLNAIRFVDLKNNPRLIDPREDIRVSFRPTLGLWTLVSKTLRLANKAGFEQFRAHFKLLNDGVVSQNHRYVVGDQATEKIFELIFGLSVLEIGTNIEVDDPEHSTGDNPDILADIGNDRWGFACKLPNGPSAKTLYDNIAKAADQIKNSSATIGVPIINLKNSIPHDELFWPLLNPYEFENESAEPIFQTWTMPSEVFRRLRDHATAKRLDVEINIKSKHVLDTFNGTKSLPVFVAYMQTSCGIVLDDNPVPSDIRDMSIQEFAPITDYPISVLQAIHLAMHDRYSTLSI